MRPGVRDGGLFRMERRTSLSIGLGNGDLFRAVFGFSPGFIVPWRACREASAGVYFHGTIDDVLPIDQCSRRIVPELKRAKATASRLSRVRG